MGTKLSIKQKRHHGWKDQFYHHPLSFAEHISKITVDDDTPLGLLEEWEKEWNIHAKVIMKKPAVRIPLPQKPPKREPKRNAYNRRKVQKEVRKQLIKDLETDDN